MSKMLNKFQKVVAHVTKMNNFREQVLAEQDMEFPAPEVVIREAESPTKLYDTKKLDLAKVDKETAMQHAINKLKTTETFSMLYAELVKFKDMFWI